MEIPFRFLNHKQRVLQLYKNSLRQLELFYGNTAKYGRLPYRYEAVLLRAEFDANKCVSDEEATTLLIEGERRYEESIVDGIGPAPKFKGVSSPTYNRYPVPPDWVLDYWHPLEKQQYPDYFARRELRKKEYIEMWNKEYGSEESEQEPKGHDSKLPHCDET